MAKFPIQRAPEKLGVVPTTAVRADLDVRTGGEELAQAVAGFGGSIANLGLRWDLMEAATQLNEAAMKSEQEHNRLMLALPGIEPKEHAKAYEKSLKAQQGFMPENRRAASAYGQFLNDYAPQRELDVKKATKAKLKDNMEAVGFVSQQEAIESGNFKNYFKHLEEGKILGVYDAEEVAKYKQATKDGHVLYVKRLKAEVERQKEIDFATHDPATYWKLLRRVTANPKGITEDEIAAAVGPNSITTDDYKELNRIRLSKADPLKTPRAQIYFKNLEELFEAKEEGIDTLLQYDTKMEQLSQFLKANPTANPKQIADFYETLILPVAEGIFEKFWRWNLRLRPLAPERLISEAWKRYKTKGGKDLSEMTDEELEAIIRE